MTRPFLLRHLNRRMELAGTSGVLALGSRGFSGPKASARRDRGPMTLPQVFSFGIIAAAMALFAWGRLRYDLVALLALLAAIATGIVPFDKAFTGFSDDLVSIVACALLVSAAVGRSGVLAAEVAISSRRRCRSSPAPA